MIVCLERAPHGLEMTLSKQAPVLSPYDAGVRVRAFEHDVIVTGDIVPGPGHCTPPTMLKTKATSASTTGQGEWVASVSDMTDAYERCPAQLHKHWRVSRAERVLCLLYYDADGLKFEVMIPLTGARGAGPN